MSAGYAVGELVDITIKGALVIGGGDPRGSYFFVEYPIYQTASDAPDSTKTGLHFNSPSVTVERVAPAEWPPVAGDLWRDRVGALWFTTAKPTWLVSAEDASDHALAVLTERGPLTLVHREPQPTADDDESEGGQS